MTSTKSRYGPGDEPVPGYRLTAFLGAGGFGEVWRATAPGGTPAALKIVDLGTREGRKEFRALAVIKQLQHPNLVPISAYWLKDAQGRFLDQADMEEVAAEASVTAPAKLTETIALPRYRPPLELFIAMGLGRQNLLHRLTERKEEGHEGIDTAELLRYMEDVASAIDHLGNPLGEHGQVLGGVQHGDIKPQNMLIVSGRAQLCDFGLARALTDIRQTSVAGSPVYMAPEMIQQGAISSASDQYSLAVSYFELRTGRLPFADGLSAFQIWRAHLDGGLDFSALPPAEREVIQQATARDPADRFASAMAMVEALRKAVDPSPAPPAGIPPPPPKPASRWMAAALIALAAAAALGWLATRQTSTATQAAPGFTLQVKPILLHAGQEEIATVQVIRTDFGEPIRLAWSNLPEGVRVAEEAVAAPEDYAVDVKFLTAPQARPQITTARLLASAAGAEQEASVEMVVEPIEVWLPPDPPGPPQWQSAANTDYIQTDRWYAARIEYVHRGLTVPFVFIPHDSLHETLDFYIMEDKATNALFARFVKEHPEMAGGTRGAAGDAESARLPALNVTWDEAAACAAWLGGRLPSGRQWDKAAGRFETGESHREGPYVGVWKADNPLDIAVGLKKKGPRPVGASKDDVSPFLCRDMAGNGLEWTRDRSAEFADLRGQNYALSEPLFFSGLDELGGVPASAPAAKASPYIGFRVVVDDLTPSAAIRRER